jgi:hypothetical protein
VVGDFKQCSSRCGAFSKVGGVSELCSLQAYAGGESLMRKRVRTCSEMSASRVIGDRVAPLLVAPLLQVQTVGDGITLIFARSCPRWGLGRRDTLPNPRNDKGKRYKLLTKT